LQEMVVGAPSHPVRIEPRAVLGHHRDRGLTLQAGAGALKLTHCYGESAQWLGFAGVPPKANANSSAQASADP